MNKVMIDEAKMYNRQEFFIFNFCQCKEQRNQVDSCKMYKQMKILNCVIVNFVWTLSVVVLRDWEMISQTHQMLVASDYCHNICSSLTLTSASSPPSPHHTTSHTTVHWWLRHLTQVQGHSINLLLSLHWSPVLTSKSNKHFSAVATWKDLSW